MKIFSAEQIRQWDQYTIQHEPIAGIDLMERAAATCTAWLNEQQYSGCSFHIFCGSGNNGGDGLAIARMLLEQKNRVTVYSTGPQKKGSAHFEINLHRLQAHPGIIVHFIATANDLPLIGKEEIIIDALFGTGLNRPPEGIAQEIIRHINHTGATIISIDTPSGLFIDRSSKSNTIVEAAHTLSFQSYKLAFLLPENEAYTGKVHILDIGLHKEYEKTTGSHYELIDEQLIRSLYKPRKEFSHKGTFGHALLVAGSYGKIGAAVLAARACLRSGVGLLSVHLPSCGYTIMQGNVPGAMVLTDFNSSYCTRLEEDITQYKAVGIGPGLGTASETAAMLGTLLTNYPQSMVIDADALNILSRNRELIKAIPTNCILTPHPKEFERLFGKTETDMERIQLASAKASELDTVIILKGHHTFIALPGGKGFFNSTGNAGMATGGTGDVLTGLLTGLLAQGYEPWKAAVLGVYLHGLAGDIAAEKWSMEGMTAEDLVESVGEGFKKLRQG